MCPRRPIDLTDDAAVTEVLDLAIKVGAVLLDSATGAIDTQAQVRFVASLYGVENLSGRHVAGGLAAAAFALASLARLNPLKPATSPRGTSRSRSPDRSLGNLADLSLSDRSISPSITQAAIDAHQSYTVELT